MLLVTQRFPKPEAVQRSYRSKATNALGSIGGRLLMLVFALLIVWPDIVSAASVSRMQFLEQSLQRLHERKIDEAEALKSHLIDAFPDGKMHLDYPITRAGAVRALYRLLMPEVRAIPWPRSADDIASGTETANALAILGGAFPPGPNNKFQPDRFLNDAEFEVILTGLVRHLRTLPQRPAPLAPVTSSVATVTAAPVPTVVTTVASASATVSTPVASAPAPAPAPATAATTLGSMRFDPLDHASSSAVAIRFGGEFRPIGEASTSTGVPGPDDAAAMASLSHLHRFLPPAQLDVAPTFDLVGCESGVASIAESVDSLEINATELIGATNLLPEHLRQVREALTTILSLLEATDTRLRFANDQLRAATFHEPDSIRRSKRLAGDIDRHRQRLILIAARIRRHLAQSPKPEENAR